MELIGWLDIFPIRSEFRVCNNVFVLSTVVLLPKLYKSQVPRNLRFSVSRYLVVDTLI
jgi:hypothetical protein